MKKVRKTKTNRGSKKGEDTKDTSPKVFQDSKINFELTINERDDLTVKQKAIIELIEDKRTKVIFIQGPAGTSKTFTAIHAALKLMNKKAVSHLIYIRSIAESASKSLGSLPGEADEKMAPFLMPLRDKLSELLPSDEVMKLEKEHRIQGIPVNFLRGSSINAKALVVDEAQNFTYEELVTTITRIGQFSKFIFCGDAMQSDIKNSGFKKMIDKFDSPECVDEGIVCIKLGPEDIVRSGILKFIIERLEGVYVPPSKSERTEPMFTDED